MHSAFSAYHFIIYIFFLSAGLSHFHFSTLLANMFLGLPANPIFPGFP